MSVPTIDVPRVRGFTEADTEPAPVWFGSRDQLLVTCGGCGMALDISTWGIDESGVVTPSIHHIEPSCGWHVFLRLLDWEAQPDEC